MSGSSGSSGSGGGGQPDPPASCLFSFTTTLNSPVPSVLAQLRISDVLDVQILNQSPERIGAVHPTLGLAGTITAQEVTRLLNCLRGGFHYDAVVIELRSPVCRIEVRPRT
jgi:hypothetical protein